MPKLPGWVLILHESCFCYPATDFNANLRLGAGGERHTYTVGNGIT